jgi:uncharacterized membrane protein YfcA
LLLALGQSGEKVEDDMLELPLWLWIVALITGLIASTVNTIVSIGTGLITYGVLSFFIDLKIAIPIVAPAHLLAVSLRFWLFRHHIHWRLAWCFFLGVIPGIYCGTVIFHILSELVLRRSLGVFLLGFAAYQLFQRKAVRVAPHVGLLPLGGLCAGILLGSIGIAGPLLAVVFLRYGLLKEGMVAMIALFFLVANTQRTLLYWQQGALVGQSLGLAVVLGMAMLGGVYLGRLILPRVSRELFVKLVLGMLVLFGVQFLVW